MKKIILLLTLVLTVFAFSAYADQILSVTASITAENTFTDSITTKSGDPGDMSNGYLGVYLFGTASDWSGTATLQAKFDYGTAGDAWQDIKSYDSTDAPFDPERITQYEPGCIWRLGIKTGDYTSGTLPVRLSRVK